jgi:hypothetical protein
VFAISFAACTEMPTTASSSAAGTTTNCSDWGCLSNAASMGDRLVFHELDACNQRVNAAGIKLVGFQLGGTAMSLRVRGDALIAIDTVTSTQFTGNQLVGGILKLASTATGEFFDVPITDVGQTNFWVGPMAPTPAYTFQFRIGKAPSQFPDPTDRDGFTAVCAGKHLDAESLLHHPVDQQVAVVFGRDRYNARTKTVTVNPNDECWFNIACAGSAVAKMHLLRHTEAGSDATHTTTQPQRQAMLKTITDDICGTGHSFTQDGEDVYYRDLRAWHPLPSVLGTTEAIWDPGGAVCLDEPRRLKEDGPDLRTQINAECAARWPGVGGAPPTGPPSCSSLGLNPSTWTIAPGTRYGISVNPP